MYCKVFQRNNAQLENVQISGNRRPEGADAVAADFQGALDLYAWA
jgi:hypothetical protein